MNILKSSTGSGDTAATVKGIAILLIPIAIMIGERYGIPLTESILISVVDQATAVAGAAILTFGLSRKLYYYIKAIKK